MSEQVEGTDVAGEFVDEHLNMAVMQSQRVLELLARRIEDQRRDAEHRMHEQTQQTRQQIDAQRDAARMQYRRVMNDRWWETTNPRDAAATIETAIQWRNHDPEANVACQKIDSELQARWGITLDDVENHLAAREAERSARDSYAGSARDEHTTESSHERDAERAKGEDRDHDGRDDNPQDISTGNAEAAEHEGKSGHDWDSSEARGERAAYWDTHLDPESAAAAKTADHAQGSHPRAAATAGRTGRRTPAMRRAGQRGLPGRGKQTELGR